MDLTFLSGVLVPELLIAAAATMLGGIARGFSGFGAAIIQAPVFALLYPPSQAVATLAGLGTLASFQLVPAAFKQAQARQLIPLTVAALIAVPFGSLILVVLEADTMRRTISAIVLGMVVVLMSGKRLPWKPGPWSAAGTGLVSGGINGATGAGGPPAVLYFLSGPESAATNRANLIVYYAFLNGATAVTLLWHRAYTPETVARTLLLWPVQLASVWAGVWLFKRASDAIYRKIALGLMLAVALFGLLYQR